MSTPWTAEQAAQFHADVGLPVVERDGVFWMAQARRFWHPVDYLAVLEPQPRPAAGAAGYHHLTHPELATAVLPMRVITDVQSFTDQRLSMNLRKDLRRCRLRADVAQASDPELLLRQGYDIWSQASLRTGQARPRSALRFARLIHARWRADPQIVIVAQADGHLVGFLLAHVIGTHCLFEEVVIGDVARTWCLGVAMYSAALHEAKALGATTVFLGLDTPEIPGLQRFKARMGGHAIAAPAHSALVPGLGLYLRKRHPVKYARLAGSAIEGPASGTATFGR